MESATLVLLLCTFGLITSLPRIFFLRSGRFNLRWWSTAIPVGLCPAFVIAAVVFDWPTLAPVDWLPWFGGAAVVPLALSIGLIAMTLGTHAQPIALWHQDNDDPEHLVTHGAYSRIRHPFYTAFLLAFLGAVLAFPHVLTIGLGSYMAVMLTILAIREEGKFGRSAFGPDYREYMNRTGRFVPRVRS